MSENGDAAIKLFGKTIPLRPSSSGGHDEKVLRLATSSFRSLITFDEFRTCVETRKDLFLSAF